MPLGLALSLSILSPTFIACLSHCSPSLFSPLPSLFYSLHCSQQGAAAENNQWLGLQLRDSVRGMWRAEKAAEDRERGVTDCIFSAVRAVNHISGVASHHSSDVNQLQSGVCLHLCVFNWQLVPATKQDISYRRGKRERQKEEGTDRWTSPAADDKSADEDDK